MIRMHSSRSHQRKSPLIRGLILAMLLAPALPAQAGSLRGQLEKLITENGIRIEGLDQIGAEPSRKTEGELEERIKTLLTDYNYLIVRGAGGKIERLTITSLKQISPRPRISGTVKTRRLGSHHQVATVLSGPNGEEITTSLLVDTGATTLVLPESMIARLGFTATELQPGMSQTAAGTVPVRIGMLQSVRVGDVAAENVPVSFIADKRLHGARLLGMSFLNRFRFSLDDENNELLLLSK
ncbi:MAG: retropepsin-like aspartic protease [Methylococcaceae bacterium]|nr:retropepsin-like aspartic protease [Methylococcaceae bacterium]